MNLTVRDVCSLLSVTENTLYRWIGQGILPANRIDDQYRFNRAELLEWATARRLTVSAELFDEPDSEAAPVPDLAEALEAGGIFHGLDGADKASALRAMVEHLRVPEDLDRAFLVHVLLAREHLQSTGIGDGVAIPHVRNPIVLHVARPLITLCFLARPVDFGALDGKPVHALFSLICPTVRVHLALLARLAFALHDEAFKRVVAAQGPCEEVLAEVRRIEQELEQQKPAGQGRTR
jgi:PTS system nitrogen regulatory IIA component